MTELAEAMNITAGAETHTMSGGWSILLHNWFDRERQLLEYFNWLCGYCQAARLEYEQRPTLSMFVLRVPGWTGSNWR